jgi:hypothetical protein
MRRGKAKHAAMVVYRRSAPVVKKIGRAAGAAALEERHTIAAVLAGIVLGYAERNHVAVPDPLGIGTPATVGIAAWLLGKTTKSRMARHVATGCLAIAAWQFARSGSTTTSM